MRREILDTILRDHQASHMERKLSSDFNFGSVKLSKLACQETTMKSTMCAKRLLVQRSMDTGVRHDTSLLRSMSITWASFGERTAFRHGASLCGALIQGGEEHSANAKQELWSIHMQQSLLSKSM